MKYELKFDPKTIEHLGVKMYSTLPPALAELISNTYDADASEVEVSFHEKNGAPVSITVKDNGCGMSAQDIQEHFLVIGRNRRTEGGGEPSPRYGRMPTGKKGLGKLALFGLAKKIVLNTVKNNKQSQFELDWDKLLDSDTVYNPGSGVQNVETSAGNGTEITLRELKRKSSFSLNSIADSLSRIFIVDDNFKILLKKAGEPDVEVTNERRYAQIDQEFEWGKNSIKLEEFEYSDDIEFDLITSEKPIMPNSGLRGITIFSRGKLVNAPEFFSSSTSSHFYQYLTGWIKADFIDLLDEDVISTNRQALNWEHDKMAEFRKWLSGLVSKVGVSWREKRKKKKDDNFKSKTSFDKQEWFSTLPEDIRAWAEEIVDTLSDDEGVDESFNPVIIALHNIIPEYPNLHWRHLHPEIKDASSNGYKGQDYYGAFLEAIKRYVNKTRKFSQSNNLGDWDLMGHVFGPEPEKVLKVAAGYVKKDGTDFAEKTITNIEGAQRKLSQGVVEGGRNVVAHEEVIDLSDSGLFSKEDCLDLLSLISHLMRRIEEANRKKQKQKAVADDDVEIGK